MGSGDPVVPAPSREIAPPDPTLAAPEMVIVVEVGSRSVELEPTVRVVREIEEREELTVQPPVTVTSDKPDDDESQIELVPPVLPPLSKVSVAWLPMRVFVFT